MKPTAWRVTHYQDGVKRPNVSLHVDQARAEHVFRLYGTPAPGIPAGKIEGMCSIDEINVALEHCPACRSGLPWHFVGCAKAQPETAPVRDAGPAPFGGRRTRRTE